MSVNAAASSTGTLLEVTDEEHTLILMMRTMRLDEIMCVINLNKFFPKELPNKHHHIMNIINVHFHKSYEIHTIRTIIEFISTQPIYNDMFKQHCVKEMVEKYQSNNIAESVNVHELYLQPFTTKCIQCETPLKTVYSHRSKTVMSLTRTYKARK